MGLDEIKMLRSLGKLAESGHAGKDHVLKLLGDFKVRSSRMFGMGKCSDWCCSDGHGIYCIGILCCRSTSIFLYTKLID